MLIEIDDENGKELLSQLADQGVKARAVDPDECAWKDTKYGYQCMKCGKMYGEACDR